MSKFKAHSIQRGLLYPPSMEKMNQVFSSLKQGSEDQILAFEYEPLFTLGRSLSKTELLLPDSIPSFKTERGGLVTFHNPGQLVIYPILNLRRLKLGVKDFIFKMEETVLKSLSEFSIESFRKEACPGVFTASGKVMSMGFRIREGISTHGIAVNVCNELEDFQGLSLCSSKSAKLDRLMNYDSSISTESFYEKWLHHFYEEFYGLKIESIES